MKKQLFYYLLTSILFSGCVSGYNVRNIQPKDDVNYSMMSVDYGTISLQSQRNQMAEFTEAIFDDLKNSEKYTQKNKTSADRFQIMINQRKKDYE